MIAQPAKVGAKGTDSVQAITPDQAAALKAAGVDFCVRYLGSVTADEVNAILNAGLGFMPVTFGNEFDGDQAVARCQALGLPTAAGGALGVTVWLDVEGTAIWKMDPAALSEKINAWAAAVQAAGYQPGLYVGAPQPLTSAELYALKTVRYWKGQGRTVDHTGALAEPRCGWCMTQIYPSQSCGGVWVDFDFIGQDYEKRVPTWAVQNLGS